MKVGGSLLAVALLGAVNNSCSGAAGAAGQNADEGLIQSIASGSAKVAETAGNIASNALEAANLKAPAESIKPPSREAGDESKKDEGNQAQKGQGEEKRRSPVKNSKGEVVKVKRAGSSGSPDMEEEEGTCFLQKAVELVIHVDASRSFDTFTTKARSFLPILLNNLKVDMENLKVSVTQFADRPNYSNIGHQCFKGTSPLTADLVDLETKLQTLTANLGGSFGGDTKEDSLYSAGWVASKYAGFSHSSIETVSRILLLITDAEPHTGGADPTSAYAQNELPCPGDKNYAALEKVGSIMRTAQVFPIVLLGGATAGLKQTWRNSLTSMGYAVDTEARIEEFDMNTNSLELGAALFDAVLEFSCAIKDRPTLVPTEEPTTPEPTTKAPTTPATSTNTPTTQSSTSATPSSTEPKSTASTKAEEAEADDEEEEEEQGVNKTTVAATVASAAAGAGLLAAGLYYYFSPKGKLVATDAEDTVQADVPEQGDVERDQPIVDEYNF